MTRTGKPTTLETALTVTALLLEAGYAVLPAEPTAAALAAGTQAGQITEAQALAVYRAMHRAGAEAGGSAAQDPLVMVKKLLQPAELLN